MKITITVDQVVFERNLPTSWDEVTFGQFLKLEECGQDYAKIVGMFLGMDADIIRRAKIRDLDGILLKLRFLNDEVPLSLPKKMLGYDIPKDLGLETIGQFMDFKKDVAEERTPRERLARYATYCAMYACKPYDWQKAEAMAPEFLNAPASEVLAVGHFTLLKLIGSATNTKNDSPRLRTRLRRFKQALKNWLRNTGIMLRYYIWRLKPGKTAN